MLTTIIIAENPAGVNIETTGGGMSENAAKKLATFLKDAYPEVFGDTTASEDPQTWGTEKFRKEFK